MSDVILSPETMRRIDILFPPGQRDEAASILTMECGNNLPFLEKLNEYELERFRYAALKLSNGRLEQLRRATDIANLDWRDLLMAAGFGENVDAHREWLPNSAER